MAAPAPENGRLILALAGDEGGGGVCSVDTS